VAAALPDGEPCLFGGAAGVCTEQTGLPAWKPFVCTAGQCDLAADATLCTDEIDCTLDTCDTSQGCGHEAKTKACDDGKFCTEDLCSVLVGCLWQDLTAGCDDGDPCTDNDKCTSGQCIGGPNACACARKSDCATVNPCLPATCGPGGTCLNSPALGAVCDDGDICTVKDACTAAGLCAGQPNPCSDGVDCTLDVCVKPKGCKHSPSDAACEDGQTCTIDFCDLAKGCMHQPADAKPCEDGDLCTTGEICQGWTCPAGKKTDCNDANPCTVEQCDKKTGQCVFANLPDGQGCDDADACTQKDACLGGKCTGGLSPCDDGNVCTKDSCLPAGGCQHDDLEGAPCDADGDACTGADACTGGKCTAGKPLACDDANACTADKCDKAKGCLHEPMSNGLACGTPGEAKVCLGGICKAIPGPAGMAWVAPATFKMGCNEAIDNLCKSPEKPYHSVQLSGFYIDQTEVTVAAYGKCVTAGVCKPPTKVGSGDATFGVVGKESFPVNWVNYGHAVQFCAWKGGRLCTEAEWEYAARGGDGRRYPWGEAAPTCAHANYIACPAKAPQAVGQAKEGASPFGLLDMAGNVREWIADWYGAEYYAASGGLPVVDPAGPSSGPGRGLRGGYYKSDASELRCSNRSFLSPTLATETLGLRCCQGLK
jgi:formylglycine-generating enzyme required for sulfatase activity